MDFAMKLRRIIVYLLKLFVKWFTKPKKDAITADRPAQAVRLITSDGYVLTDTNGLLITIKEDK